MTLLTIKNNQIINILQIIETQGLRSKETSLSETNV